MARLTLQLTVDPVTGARQVRVGYTSDPDALPMEHEAEHAALVRQVSGGAPVERERGAAVAAPAEPEAAHERRGQLA